MKNVVVVVFRSGELGENACEGLLNKSDRYALFQVVHNACVCLFDNEKGIIAGN
jgi:hypothetical protein